MHLLLLVSLAFFVGCGRPPYRPTAGAQATLNQPLHASSGIGVTIWKIPIVGVGAWGMGGYSLGGPPVVVNRYDSQATPPRTSGGLPVEAPAPVTYQTVYPSAPFNDPTLVILQNTSYRATLWTRIDDGEEMVLEPQRASGDIRLDVGDHRVRVRGEVATGLGPRPIPERVLTFRVDPRGQPHIIPLSEY